MEGFNYCMNCGYKLDPSDNFCPNCGVKLEEYDSMFFDDNDFFLKYEIKIDALNDEYNIKMNKALELIKKQFDSSQISYSNFISTINDSNNVFYNNVEIARDIIKLSDKPSLKIKNELDSELLDIFTNGTKVYAVPKGLDKGLALRRIRERLGADKIIAAGDSEFDIPMLRSADIAVCPKGLAEGEGVISCGEDQLLAEFMLKAALDITGSKQTASEVFN